jgi:demethylspheroidene O-methyltransferase
MPAAAEAETTLPPVRLSFRDRVYGWRDRLLASPAFHRWAVRFPFTRPIARRQARTLFDLCAGFVYAQVLSACIELELFEVLAEGPMSSADLSRRLCLPPDSTRRLLAAAVSLGLVERRGEDRFGLGLLGAATLGNPAVGAMVRHHSVLYRDLADPVALLRRGGGGGGLARYWPYATSNAPVGTGGVEPYTRLMAASQPLVAEQILDAYPLGRHRSLLDVGGGAGAFLAAAARRAPNLALTLFDLPAVAALARARFAQEGLAHRATAFGGDVFADPLPRGSDVISLVRVIHDHDDGPALAILRAVRAALPPGGTLLVAEPMAGAAGAEPVGAYFSFYLMAMGSGRPRTAAELKGLLEAAGFVRTRALPTPIPLLTSVLVAIAGPSVKES